MQVLEIPVDSIKVESKFVRDEPCRSLVRSIKTVGLIHPLVVDQSFNLIAGGRRLAAIKHIGWEKVTVIISKQAKNVNDLMTIDENIVRKDCSGLMLEQMLAERKKLYEQLKPPGSVRPGGKQKSFASEMAERLNMSAPTISNMIRRANLQSDKVLEARINKEVTDQTVTKLVSLKKEDQDRVLELVKGAPASYIDDIIEAAKTKSIEQIGLESKHMQATNKIMHNIKISAERLDKHVRKALKEDIIFNGPNWNETSGKLCNVYKRIKKLRSRHREIKE